jgi:hypothetical protein
MKRLLKPWVFVLTGVVFNISSAVITHYFIGLNNDRIAEIDRMINNKQVLIDSLWQSKTEIERKKEFFILYYGQAGKSPMAALVDRYYQDYLHKITGSYELKELEAEIENHAAGDLDFLLEFSAATETFIIESINDSYFEKLDLEATRSPIEQRNSQLFSIAIFLQVIGLILILARDLRKH